MTHANKIGTVAVGQNIKNKAKSLSQTHHAIRRSREILQQAELAVTRSYAVVELSKIYIDSIDHNSQKS